MRVDEGCGYNRLIDVYMNDNIYASRLSALRQLMADGGVSGAIFPQTDPHQSEYIAAHWHVIKWLCGFSGSAGTLVVTLDGAWLWTDSRYFLQAATQLKGSGVELMKMGVAGTPGVEDFLCGVLKPGENVGINGMLFSVAQTRKLRSDLSKSGVGLDTDFDPIPALWADRPQLGKSLVYEHTVNYAGQQASEKIDLLLAKVKERECDGLLLCALDEIAWTLNLRASDIKGSPVAMAFLYLGCNGDRVLFVNAPASEAVTAHLNRAGITVKAYDDVTGYLAALDCGLKVLASPTQTSQTIAEALGCRMTECDSLVAMPKAIKNDIEISGFRDAMVRDGVAMVRSLIELENRIDNDIVTTELDVEDILLKHRKAQKDFVDVSFGTISGYGSNGAIVHYSATAQSNATIEKGNLLLIDSGGNYLDGTTDLTRTIAIGEPSAGMRHDFTLVMKGHIALAKAVFPHGTCGTQLDVLARTAMWHEGKNYLHGTGHGVGHFLNCHEGPQSIRMNYVGAPLLPGMVTSNEPGIYLAGKYGIRCENLMLTEYAFEGEYGAFYRFTTITLCPFDSSLFEIESMTTGEIAWVDDYHRQVYEALSPHLESDERLWLQSATKPLNK